MMRRSDFTAGPCQDMTRGRKQGARPASLKLFTSIGTYHMCFCVHVQKNGYIHMYIHIYIYMYMYMNIYIYIYSPPYDTQ